ncbi:ATP-dependent DNA helicase ddm1 [Sarracenia purpurea var. burkii]
MKGKLNNLVIQLQKNCYHPDLLESAFDGSYFYPPVEKIVEQCGKFRLLDKLLAKLFARKHKEEELLALLRDDEDAEDKMVQTDISDEDLERMLRVHY